MVNFSKVCLFLLLNVSSVLISLWWGVTRIIPFSIIMIIFSRALWAFIFWVITIRLWMLVIPLFLIDLLYTFLIVCPPRQLSFMMIALISGIWTLSMRLFVHLLLCFLVISSSLLLIHVCILIFKQFLAISIPGFSRLLHTQQSFSIILLISFIVSIVDSVFIAHSSFT